MTRITHFKHQPVNVQYWDYYILCHLNTDATIALQRIEYWDGTKEDGNAHAEDINEAMEQQGQPPTQDTSRWIYKSQDELQWELMGVAGEKHVAKLLRFLIKELKYLECRHNPSNTWDRKKQYGFNDKLVQDHISYLGYIVSFFHLPLRRLCPVFYAIEALTASGVYIDTLNVNQVITKIEELKSEKVPHFLKAELEKFSQSFQKPDIQPFRNFAEWKTQSCGKQTGKLRNGKRNPAESTPQKRGSNSIEFKTENTDREHKEDTDTVVFVVRQNDASLSSDVEIEARDNVLTVVFDAYDAPDFFQVRELPVVKTWLTQSPTLVGGNTRPFDESRGNHTPPLSGVGEIGDTHGHYSADAQLHPRLSDSTNPSPRSDAPRAGAPADPNQEQALDPVIVSTTEARGVVTPSLPYDETPSREIDSQRHSEGVIPTGVTRNQQVSDVSYSPGDSKKSETPAPEGEPPKTTRRRGTRKPRAKKPEPFVVPEELRERVDKVYAFLDKLRQEVTNDPEERFIHDMDSDKAICELFEGKPPTETRMKKVFLGMWNEARNPRTGYLPRDHMTIPAICKQYKSKAMSLAADENTKALVNTISNQQQYQVVTEDDDMAFTRPSERNRRIRQGA